jgi:hypothetical protein
MTPENFALAMKQILRVEKCSDDWIEVSVVLHWPTVAQFFNTEFQVTLRAGVAILATPIFVTTGSIVTDI